MPEFWRKAGRVFIPQWRELVAISFACLSLLNEIFLWLGSSLWGLAIYFLSTRTIAGFSAESGNLGFVGFSAEQEIGDYTECTFQKKEEKESRWANRSGELYPISSNSWQICSSRSSLHPLSSVFVEPEVQIWSRSHNLPVFLTEISVRDMLNIFECLIRDGERGSGILC